MIITRTPLRISLAGGGTDQPGFFKQTDGAVVSFAIDKYIYVLINDKFDGKNRVSYSITENVDLTPLIRHDIIREALLKFNVHGVEIVTVGDIPGGGTGLGSSSALAVGLVRALCRYTGVNSNVHPPVYAEMAYEIERDRCGYPVGKQDHWASAHGGLNLYRFMKDSVTVKPLIEDINILYELENRFVLLWTGRNRPSADILKQQEANFSAGRLEYGETMRNIALQLSDELAQGYIANIGAYLHENWMFKRGLAKGITNDWIDQKYDAAMEAGAKGGKICGAGGGGFFLFYGPLGIGPDLEKATGLKRVPFKITQLGSEVIYGQCA